MSTGTVKWFNTRKGYGFIIPDEPIKDANDKEKDVFVHVSELQKIGLESLEEGQPISYEIYDDRGRAAAGKLNLK